MATYYWENNGYRIEGDNSSETLNGTDFDDNMDGYGGNDILYGYDGDDWIWGGDGDDWIFGGLGNNWLHGNIGNDNLYGGSDNDWLVGGEGDDYLVGNSGNDYLVGGPGNDYLDGSWGDDVLCGNDGYDTFVFKSYGGHDVIIDADNGDTILESNIMPWQSDVSCWYDGGNNIMYIFTPAGQLDVHCSNGTPWPALPVYQFADGSRWQYIWSGVNSNNNWHQISYDAAEDTGADIAANPLWGNANEFFGTAQADNIFVSRTNGNDLVFDTDSADTVHLYDATLSDIVSTSVSDNAIAIEFNTGEVAMVSSAENTSPTFKLASGQSYVYNRETSSWREA